MARIAYILLCHKDAESIIRQAERLTAAGDFVAIHLDARAPRAAYASLRQALADNPNVVFARRRLRCGWGEWSLVAATLLAVEAAEAAFPRATHFYMISGDCMPIKPAERIRAVLDADDVDHVECVDFHDGGWIKTGLRDERLIYRHWFNERRSKRLFYTALDIQKRLGLRRRVPDDLRVMIGSQWWCLRRRTVEAVLDLCRARPDIVRFFRRTWIPDETFFQTLVRHLVPAVEIRSRSPTFLMFSDYGMPVSFYNDHYDLLVGQDFLFARKISNEAHDLRRRLGELYAARGVEMTATGDGRALYTFLAGRGRVGRRFAPRAWEGATTLGADRELLIVTCKKWHVGKRLMARIRSRTDLPAFDYLFDEEVCALPDLGGIQTSLAKRTRHRRALVKLLFGACGADRMAICLDPANAELLRDLRQGGARIRILDLACAFSDADLAAHAQRVGLAAPAARPAHLDTVLPALRRSLTDESRALRDGAAGPIEVVDEAAPHDQNAAALARFLPLPGAAALAPELLDTLFTD